MKTMLTVLGFYYVVTGVWPLLSIVSFQMFTGVKKDTWLVRMVGLLAAAIGLTLLYSAFTSEGKSSEMVVLAVLSTFSFAVIDITYARRKVIPKIYLVDAVVEVFFLSYFIGRSFAEM